jgi:hypothetical protein
MLSVLLFERVRAALQENTLPHEITAEEIAEGHRAGPLRAWVDDYCRHWLEANVDSADLDFIKSTHQWFWGPGTILSETEYLRIVLGRDPSRTEVLGEIERSTAIMEACHAALHEDSEFLALRRFHATSPGSELSS